MLIYFDKGFKFKKVGVDNIMTTIFMVEFFAPVLVIFDLGFNWSCRILHKVGTCYKNRSSNTSGGDGENSSCYGQTPSY